MTIAVCLKCGSMKHGAWTPCQTCGHLPESLEDKAKHLFLTDHYHQRDELDPIAEAIRSGKAVNFPEDMLAAVAKEIARSEEQWTKGGLASGLPRLP